MLQAPILVALRIFSWSCDCEYVSTLSMSMPGTVEGKTRCMYLHKAGIVSLLYNDNLELSRLCNR
jgi:hypothetical protein